ncbi:MAG TPA: Wzz/FepE/Etk N-terminal domain-containing protein [Sumerlaeia bacterium]|nr:Wzz/FepE/Etk N-terminal domain-containing protein [Sumerlaeia bacterium]
MQTEDWKRELCEIFFARIWTILITTAVVFAGAVAVTYLWPQTYSTTGSVVMRGKRPQISPEMLETLDVRILSITKEDLSTEAEILGSTGLVRQTLEALRAEGVQPPEEKSRVVLPAALARNLRPVQDPTTENVRKIREKLRTETVPASNVVQVSLRGTNPQWSESFLGRMLDEYLVYRSSVFNPGGEGAFFRERADLYRLQLEQVEEQLIDAATTSSVTLIEREMTNNLDLKMDLEKQLTLLRDEYIQKEKDAASLRKAIGSNDVQFFSFLDNDALIPLNQALAGLTALRAEALRDFRPDSDKVRALNTHIKNAYQPLLVEAKQILSSRESELEGLLSRIGELETAVRGLEERNVTLQRLATDFLRITREADLLKFSYETFSKRREEAEINSAIARASLSGDVSILTRPVEGSAELLFPRPLATPILGIVAGLIAGCGLALLGEYLDHRVRRPADIGRHIGLPVICSLKKA